MAGPLIGFDNPFDEFLENDVFGQRATFFGNQPQNQTPNERRSFQDSFRDVHNQYLGQLGRQIFSGEDPTQRFRDFMGNFNFSNFFNQQSPNQRSGGFGDTKSLFSPPTRTIFNF